MTIYFDMDGTIANLYAVENWLPKLRNKDESPYAEAKMNWLRTHLKSVHFDEIHIVAYGTPKHEIVKDKNGILFDDEEKNRTEWKGTAFDVDNIIGVLKEIA